MSQELDELGEYAAEVQEDFDQPLWNNFENS